MKTLEIIQYLRPYGKTKVIFAGVTDEYFRKAAGMVFSAETLSTGDFAVYGRYKDQREDEEEIEFADTCNMDNTPTHALKRVIDKVYMGKEGDYGK